MPAFRYQHGDRPLEGYTIEHAVGRGGFGEVYYAVSDAGRQVALKVLQYGQEIELRGIGHCMNLKSPHLVSIFDVRQNEHGDWFVIMEFVSGPSLRDVLDESPGGLGPAKTAFFLREIAKGLGYLHDCGIVHRDLKPHNVFYEDGYVKIGDYSLSKAITASQHTGHTMTVGTVHYMAPEIGQGRYDRSTDIYALGVMLYEMLTGRVPHAGATPGEVLMKHMSGEVDLTQVDEPFRSVIRKAMAGDPAERYQSAAAMVEDVFGAEHIQNSVSGFRPETLTLAGERAAQKMANASGGSNGSVRVATPRPTPRITPPPRQATPRPQAPEPPREVREQYVPDPLDWRTRIGLAAGTAAVVGMAAAILTGTPGAVLYVGCSLMMMAMGLGLGQRISVRLDGELPWLGRLLMAGIAAGMGWLTAIWLTEGLGFRGGLISAGHLEQVLIAVSLGALLLDWRKTTDIRREERLSLSQPMSAALIALVAAAIFGADMVLSIALLAGLSLVAQAGYPRQRRELVEQTADGSEEPMRAAPAASLAGHGPVEPSAGLSPAGNGAAKSKADLPPHISPQNRTLALLMSLVPLTGIVPVFGVHRFYVGKIGTGVLWLITFGLFGIGQIVDAILIGTGQFSDSQGRRVELWETDGKATAAAKPDGSAGGATRPLYRPTPSHWMLHIAGTLLLSLGLAVGVALALEVPRAIAAGLLEPGIPADPMGWDNWAGTAHRLGVIAVTLILIMATLVLTLARRDAGGAHLLRLLLAVLGLIVGLTTLGEITHLAGPQWVEIASAWHTDQPGRAVGLWLERFRDLDATVLTLILFGVSLLLLFWPAKARPQSNSAARPAAQVEG
ncbi:MAG: protein kinase domain-containing protein [Phycisphaeraceae bacterium]